MLNNHKHISNELCLYCSYKIYSEKDFKTCGTGSIFEM